MCTGDRPAASLSVDPGSTAAGGVSLRHLQATNPVCRVSTPAGGEAWLVTRHAENRELLTDERVGHWHPNPESAQRYVDSTLMPMVVDGDAKTARREHLGLRELLIPSFSASIMRRLKPKVEEFAAATLDSFVAYGPPADLRARFSEPLVESVFSEFMGLSPEDWPWILQLRFQATAMDQGSEATDAIGVLRDYMTGVIARKRSDPGDDMISRLCAAWPVDEDLANCVMSLVIAGFEPIVDHIGSGVILFSAHPDQREVALRDPRTLTDAVEEVLRKAVTGGIDVDLAAASAPGEGADTAGGAQRLRSVVDPPMVGVRTAIPRYAAEEIKVGDMTIGAGDTVLFDYGLANADPRVFTEPDKFDVSRSPNPHLSFSYGLWHCVGAPLARMVLQVAFSTLYSRVPSLRLAVPSSALVEVDDHHLGTGFAELPVDWDERPNR